MIFITIVAFIVIFSVLVLVHEWGHFTAARKSGIRVEEFGIGLPPRAKAIAKDKKGTVYSLNWIPFGGYVRLYGEDVSDPKVLKDKQSFASKTILQRTAVVCAGVFMNFVLAWVLISVGFMVGMRPFIVTEADFQQASEKGLVNSATVMSIDEIREDSPLQNTSIQAGDIILEVDGQPIPEDGDLSRLLMPNREAVLTILRGEGDPMSVNVTPTGEGRLGVMGSLQLFLYDIQKVRYPVYQAPVEAVVEVGRLSYLTVRMLGDVVASLVGQFTVPEGVAGPVGIARMTHTFTQQGFVALMQFTALLSISLGVINIMPFPALDGGRFLFILYEVITRRKPNAKMEAAIHGIGFALLMLLIVVITWNDVVQLF
jgi:regulator of sigma E protease